MTLPPITLQPGQSITIAAAGGGVKPLLDPGWPALVRTGHLTAVPTTGTKPFGPGTYSMFSPVAPTSTGETSANLIVSPTGGGLRLLYPTTLKGGGYSPVRFGFGLPNPEGTGKYYQQWLVTFMAGFQFPSANLGIKLCEPRTQSANGTGPGPMENHVVGTFPAAGAGPNDKAYYAFLQGPGSQSRNLPPNVAGQSGIITGGAQLLLETLFLPESTPGAGDGIYRAAVQGVLVADYSNCMFLGAGNVPGWPYLMVDPTYGGAAGPPPVDEWWEFDALLVETA